MSYCVVVMGMQIFGCMTLSALQANWAKDSFRILGRRDNIYNVNVCFTVLEA